MVDDHDRRRRDRGEVAMSEQAFVALVAGVWLIFVIVRGY